MRTKNGKRIGPVPIAVVAVFALAALLSAGLLVLVPQDAQAQASEPSITRSSTSQADITLDVGEVGPSVVGANLFTIMNGTDAQGDPVTTAPDTTYTISSDQNLVDDPATSTVDETTDGTATAIRTNGASAPIAIVEGSGAITINAMTQGHADLADNTARITVTATIVVDAAATPPRTRSASSSFNVTVVQNPNEVDGTAYVPALTAPATPHACTLIVGDNGDAETTSDDDYDAFVVPTSRTVDTGIAVDSGNARLIANGGCTTSENSLDVTFLNRAINTNTGSATSTSHVVYTTGGSSFRNVEAGVGKSGLNEKVVTLGNQDVRGPGMETITVTRSMVDKNNEVYLFVYVNQLDVANRIESKTAFRSDADAVIKVKFLGQPAIGKDGCDTNKVVDADPQDGAPSGCTGTDETRSKLTASPGDTLSTGDQTVVIDGKSKTITLTGASERSVFIQATVMDENMQLLKDIDVTFAATSEPSDVERTTRTRETNDMGIATHVIDGLPNDQAYRVTVVVSAGSLNLGTIVIARSGDLVDGAITADKKGGFTATICVPDEENEDKDDGCGAGKEPKSAFAAKDGTFEIMATVRDALGNNLVDSSKAALPVSIEAMEDIAGISVGDFENGVAQVIITETEVEGGSHTIELTATQGSGTNQKTATTSVTFAISGELDHYYVKGDDRILEREIKSYTVEGQDELDNPAAFDADQLTNDMHEVSIFVDGDTDMVSILDLPASQKVDLAAGKFTFRVRALPGATGEIEISVVGPAKGAAATITKTVGLGEAPPDMTVPGKPMNVEAMADGLDTIDVSWDAPDMDGYSPITGYIIERRYDGDMMGDITSDGYNAAAGGASFVFSDHMEWWETLNCDGMLQAANIDPASATDEQKGMYCKHFDDTAPTSMDFADEMQISDETAMKVKDLFEKRFVTDDMGNTMTMFTGMMYSDTGLMAGIEYTYRVSAVNAIGRSMWSDAAMATTAANMGPMAGADLADVMIYEGATATRQSTITDPEDDTLTWTVASSADTIATASVNTDTGEVTITGVSAGTATITVTATDADGSGMSATQTITVTVTAVPVDTSAPMGGASTVLGSTISVTWTPGSAQNTDVFKVALFNEDVTSLAGIAQPVKSFNTAAADPGAHDFSQVPSGTYTVVLAAVNSDGMHVTSIVGTVTVN